MSEKVIEIVTQRFIDALESGTAPWKQCWSSQRSRNFITGRPYSGVNSLLTHPMVTGFKEPGFLTYNQAKKLGAQVRKGEPGLPIMFFKRKESEDNKKDYLITRFYKLWNTSQIDGLSIDPSIDREVERNETAENVIESWRGYPATEFGEFDPCYSPQQDTVYMPHAYSFNSDGEYYAALFHEYMHSTGHKSRLDRDMKPLMLDRHAYSEEELIAEIGAAFLCHHVGITTVMENQAAYCRHWLKQLKGNRQTILNAARAADKGFRMMIGEASE